MGCGSFTTEKSSWKLKRGNRKKDRIFEVWNNRRLLSLPLYKKHEGNDNKDRNENSTGSELIGEKERILILWCLQMTLTMKFGPFPILVVVIEKERVFI